VHEERITDLTTRLKSETTGNKNKEQKIAGMKAGVESIKENTENSKKYHKVFTPVFF